jgi:glycosyltransferase involved in cell wall biosynthesis
MVARDALGTAGYLGLRHLALKRADSVIANSEATLETAMPYLSPKAKRHVIPSPLGLDEYSGRPAVAHIPLSIGMIARLDTWKGQDLLIRAFKRAGLSGKANLYFIGGASFGKESYATSLRELSSDLGVAEDVNFVGHVEDIRPMLESLDICVQASTRPEPLGQNVLQYLAAGKAVIAADAGGPREWIRSGVNGLLFDLGNERRLAQHLQLLVTDAGLRERLAHQAAKTPGIRTDREVAMAHANVFAGRDQV